MVPDLGAFACASEADPASCMLRHPAGGGSTGRNCRSAACVLGARSRLGVWFPPGTPHRLALGHPRILDSRAVPTPTPHHRALGSPTAHGRGGTAAPASRCSPPPMTELGGRNARNPPMTRPEHSRHKRPSALGAVARAGGPAAGAVAIIVTACALVMATLGMTGATAAGGAGKPTVTVKATRTVKVKVTRTATLRQPSRHGDGHRDPDADVAGAHPDRHRHRPAVRHRDAHAGPHVHADPSRRRPSRRP